jgi:hypothetical protein
MEDQGQGTGWESRPFVDEYKCWDFCESRKLFSSSAQSSMISSSSISTEKSASSESSRAPKYCCLYNPPLEKVRARCVEMEDSEMNVCLDAPNVLNKEEGTTGWKSRWFVDEYACREFCSVEGFTSSVAMNYCCVYNPALKKVSASCAEMYPGEASVCMDAAKNQEKIEGTEGWESKWFGTKEGCQNFCKF